LHTWVSIIRIPQLYWFKTYVMGNKYKESQCRTIDIQQDMDSAIRFSPG